MASSPYINHFIQPDSIIPNPSNPQSWNRYSYVQNNPIRYNDPTGHRLVENEFGGNLTQYQKEQDAKKLNLLKKENNKRKCWNGQENLCSPFDKLIREIDNFDLGTGTIQIGVSGSIFGGIGVRGDVGIAFDFKGNVAFVGTGGGGGYTALGGGIGPYLTVTNAPSVDYLEGSNVQIGGQVGEVGSVGTEIVLFRGKDRNRYGGLSLTGAASLIGPWPGEFHGTATGSNIWIQKNIPDLIAEPFRPK